MLAQETKIIIPDLPVVDLDRARAFYEDKLGFEPAMTMPGGVSYQIGTSGALFLYQREATKADHTAASFVVDDLDAVMADMREKGIEFEEYDMSDAGIKTVNGVAEMDGDRAAWFKDTEGNILSIMQNR